MAIRRTPCQQPAAPRRRRKADRSELVGRSNFRRLAESTTRPLSSSVHRETFQVTVCGRARLLSALAAWNWRPNERRGDYGRGRQRRRAPGGGRGRAEAAAARAVVRWPPGRGAGVDARLLPAAGAGGPPGAARLLGQKEERVPSRLRAARCRGGGEEAGGHGGVSKEDAAGAGRQGGRLQGETQAARGGEEEAEDRGVGQHAAGEELPRSFRTIAEPR